jgi:putative ABC transport system permease protein
VAAASEQATADASQPNGNLRETEMIMYLGRSSESPIPEASTSALKAAQASAQQVGTAIGASAVITLQAAINPGDPGLPPLGDDPGGRVAAQLVRVTKIGDGTRIASVAAAYVATPELLAYSGISAGDVDPTADIISPRDLGGLELGAGGRDTIVPKVQHTDAAIYTSEPTTLISTATMQRHGLQAVTAGWLLRSPDLITPREIDSARQIAAEAGLTIETHKAPRSLKALGADSTGIGVLVALAVLAMTVGLIRSETAGDLRTLTAAGASTRTRRWLVGATAGALGLLGGLLGTAGAHLAVLAWNHGRLGSLSHTTVSNLLVLIVGLPVIAMAAGWVLAGRQPAAMARAALT